MQFHVVDKHMLFQIASSARSQYVIIWYINVDNAIKTWISFKEAQFTV